LGLFSRDLFCDGPQEQAVHRGARCYGDHGGCANDIPGCADGRPTCRPSDAKTDAFPLDSSETIDTDSGGIGDNANTDDDGDGYTDESEISIHHTDPKSADSDGDGLTDPAEALGLLKDATALPLITQRLDKTIEPDLWVRAKAATALRYYPPSTASTQLAPMLTGLRQPDSLSRTGVAKFCYDHMTLADVCALAPDLFVAATTACQADPMWARSARTWGLQTLTKFHAAEAMPLALSQLGPPPLQEWDTSGQRSAGLAALATYGDAARWTLPTLRGYLTTWNSASSEYAILVSTIASIEAAITSPAGITNLNAVANPQVVTIIGMEWLFDGTGTTRTAYANPQSVTLMRNTAQAAKQRENCPHRWRLFFSGPPEQADRSPLNRSGASLRGIR
jgi:hypothetical protein